MGQKERKTNKDKNKSRRQKKAPTKNDKEKKDKPRARKEDKEEARRSAKKKGQAKEQAAEAGEEKTADRLDFIKRERRSWRRKSRSWKRKPAKAVLAQKRQTSSGRQMRAAALLATFCRRNWSRRRV